MTYHQERLVTHNNRLHSWSIIRIFPDLPSQVIIRLSSRNDAEAHLQILRSKNPKASYELIFDIMPKSSDLANQPELAHAYANRD